MSKRGNRFSARYTTVLSRLRALAFVSHNLATIDQ
jgi:hypothetical protein